jgi:Holliday junction resolvasome RuvABC endonuclease subunit
MMREALRVCGIDLGSPGGIAVLSDDGQGIRVQRAIALPARCSAFELQRAAHEICREQAVTVVATERPGTWGRRSIGMAQRAKQELVRAVCQSLGIRLIDYQPQEIKKAITGRGRAGKEQVGRCVKLLLKIDSENEHVLDACAIALVALNRERTRKALPHPIKPVKKRHGKIQIEPRNRRPR